MSQFSGRRMLAVVATLVVVAAVGTGLVLMGPPSEERFRRLDERRVEDLQQISFSVNLYNNRHQRLPASIVDLLTEPGMTFRGDPVTGGFYGYRVLGPDMYELCALFDRASAESRVSVWSHGGGSHCFVLKADEAR